MVTKDNNTKSSKITSTKDSKATNNRNRKQATNTKLDNSKPNTLEFTILRPNAAGIDIGATSNYVALPPNLGQPVRCFESFTPDLRELVEWLSDNGITSVAMESTGVFWIPLFQLLDSSGFEVFLVNARHAKAMPGRKTDVKDCQWLQHLHSVGLLDASFRPKDLIVAIRSLTRHKDALTKTAARCIQHMQKSLTQMNIHLHHVISDISGETGLRILDAIVNGQYNPNELVKLKSRRIKASDEKLLKSLEGDYRREHIFTLKQSLEAYRNTLKLINECNNEIHKMIHDFNAAEDPLASPESVPNNTEISLHSELELAFGTDLTKVPGIGISTALQLFAEVGPAGFSQFRSDAAFASWLTLCPNHEITGGKVKSSKTRQSKSRLAAALRQAASSFANEQGFFGNMYRRLRAKFGAQKAVTAMAHKLARLIYHLITNAKEYDQSVHEIAEARQKYRQEKILRRKARQLGLLLIPA